MTSNSYRDQMNTIPQFNYQNDLQNAPQNYNKFGLPPRNAVMKKKQYRKNMHGSRMSQGGSRAPSKPGWDDSFAKKEDNKVVFTADRNLLNFPMYLNIAAFCCGVKAPFIDLAILGSFIRKSLSTPFSLYVKIFSGFTPL